MYQESLPLPLEDKQEKKNYLMKRSLLEIDCPPDAIAVMMQMENFHKDHVCYFAGPLVVHNLPWREQLPKHLAKAVYLDRLDLVYEERKKNFGRLVVGNLAVQTDIFAAMWPALMEALANPDLGIPWQYGKVALYCCYEAGIRHKWIDQTVDEFYGSVKMKPLTFPEIETEYKQVAADVRSKVVKQGKKAGWATPPSRSKPELTTAVKPKVPTRTPVPTPAPTTLKRPSTISSPQVHKGKVEPVQLNLL